MKTEKTLDVAENKVVSLLSEMESLSSGKDVIISKIKCPESLSLCDKFELPLYVHGDMIGVGKHKSRYYTADELQRGVERFNKMAFKLDHIRDRVGSTVGAVDKLIWDPDRQVVIYEAHINDETHARNILDGVVNEVSVTTEAINLVDLSYGVIASDIDFVELSLIESGAYSGNSLKVGKLNNAI